MNSAFIDTNAIIRYFTGDPEAREVLKPVLENRLLGYINNIVFSEVVFTLIKLLTGMTAYKLKKKPELVKEAINRLDKQLSFLREYFTELEIDEKVKESAEIIMREYGLLPNDALIAATCRRYGIRTIITFDEDFDSIPWLETKP